MKVNWLIVGAGLTGSVLAERLVSKGDSVLIVDRRQHIAGNVYDHYDKHGILVHKYGPHVFHTNSKKIWDYLSLFTEWNRYFHRVLASIDGQLVPVPFSIKSMEILFPEKTTNKLTELLVSEFGYGASIPIMKLRQHENLDLKWLAEFIYRKVFLGYTRKQWGLEPDELDDSVTSRIPILVSRDDRYFQDIYQAMPKYGYTEIVKKMLNHKKIMTLLNADYKQISKEISFDRMIYTGPIDEFFDFRLGELPYRSLKFEIKNYKIEKKQPCTTINYPNEYDFTRVTEFKQMTGQISDSSSLAYEYPQQFERGLNEPYYPIPQQENMTKYLEYKKLAETENPYILFVGRLGEYKYFNMDQAVGRALGIFSEKCQ